MKRKHSKLKPLSQNSILSNRGSWRSKKFAHIPWKCLLVLLMGTDALFEIYVFGKYSDIMSDHDVWEVFSPYLLLVDEDFIHYTYINDNGEVMESQVS